MSDGTVILQINEIFILLLYLRYVKKNCRLQRLQRLQARTLAGLAEITNTKLRNLNLAQIQ